MKRFCGVQVGRQEPNVIPTASLLVVGVTVGLAKRSPLRISQDEGGHASDLQRFRALELFLQDD
jgi:hypothetical protein